MNVTLGCGRRVVLYMKEWPKLAEKAIVGGRVLGEELEGSKQMYGLCLGLKGVPIFLPWS